VRRGQPDGAVSTTTMLVRGGHELPPLPE
jgi:hypothetical protein